MMIDALSPNTLAPQRRKPAFAAPDIVAQSQSVRLISESILVLAVLFWTRKSLLPASCAHNLLVQQSLAEKEVEPFDAPWKVALRLDTGAH